MNKYTMILTPKTTNSLPQTVVAKDKVRFHGEIMVPGQTYVMTKQELIRYAKHVSVVDLSSREVATSGTEVRATKSKQKSKGKKKKSE